MKSSDVQFPDRHLGFVLSAGRTGTVFLTKTLGERFPDVGCVHEPPLSRLMLMLGNFRNEVGPGGGLLRRFFLSALRRRLRRLGPHDRYVELNPMLGPIADLLPDVTRPLRVVHLVRDPRTWTASILAFKASGFRRHVIDYVPWATPYPTPRPAGWRRLGPPERALWRWRYCNEKILQIKPCCAGYELVRYEDLFSPDGDVRDSVLRRMLAALEIPTDDDLSWFRTDQRINASRPDAAQTVPTEATVGSICGPLLEQFGYENRPDGI